MRPLSLAWQNVCDQIVQVLRRASFCATLVFIAFYIVPALIRLFYPFELEWMEGAMVDHVRWIFAGESLYQRPSLTFTPFIYPPLYFYTAAFLTKILGVGFLPLRLISFLATGGACLFLYRLARHGTSRAWEALLAPGLFLATYPLSGSWLDLGRVDSLMLFLVLASVYVLRTAKTSKGMVFAGVLAVLAFLTKQLVWSFYLPLVIAFFFERRRDAIVFSTTTGLLGGMLFFVLNYASRGWLWYYLVIIPGQHGWEPGMISFFWKQDLLFPLAILCGFVGMLFSLPALVKRDDCRFYLSLVIGGIAMGWLGRLHSGGYENVLLPTYAMLSLVGVVGVDAIDRSFEKNRQSALQIILWVLFAIQWTILLYHPGRFVPTREMREAQLTFRNELAQYAQPVLVQSHGFWDGNPTTPLQAHLMALADIVRSRDVEMRESLRRAFEEKLARHAYGAIVLDQSYRWERDLIENYYVLSHERTSAVPWGLSGAVTMPVQVYVPKK